MALITGTLLFRQITRPLARLQTSALQLGSGQMNVQVPVTTTDEVGQVSRAFNHMADRIAAQEKLRQQMVADVAHELRTPLSVIRANLEAMLDGLISPEPQEIGEIHAEVLRLIRLTEDLRMLSLADAGQLRLQATQVDIGDLIETILRRMTPTADSQEITLEGDIHGLSMPVAADSDKLEQALINLLDNSLRHVPAGGQVVLHGRQTRDALIITVRDNGPGIPPGDLPHIFERFWRGDRSRSRTGGGSGLGLAIVKQIVDLHAGTIKHDTPAGGGCRFTITLPREV
jgi:two-component system sensor histidine kinase BaeS